MKSVHDPIWRRPTYWNFCRSEAALLDTDGCSQVSGFHVECCFEHDIAYRYGKDPRDAYLHFKSGSLDYWKDAKPITRGETDRRFRKCHQARSKFGKYSPMALYRWVGVRLFGGKAWKGDVEKPAPLGR